MYNINIMVSYYSFTGYYHWGKLSQGTWNYKTMVSQNENFNLSITYVMSIIFLSIAAGVQQLMHQWNQM